MKKVTEHYKRRKLTLYGRVYVIKTFLLSKIVYTASLLRIPGNILKEVKQILYEFLWKAKRDKVKRSSLSNNVLAGGLNMINVDCFILALKASWVPRIHNIKGK